MQALLDPSLDPLFWENARSSSASAWHGHVPFAHWLVANAKPHVLVELGTHTGVSYAAFCQAVQRCRLDTQCSAVDSWAGDDHAGAYGEDVYAELKAFHDAHYAAFSRLLRTNFDDAVAAFADGSIDLLHIDGFHSYEAVSHDFQTWRPKLSERAVVLFHDTHVRERGFGVWRFWEEIRDTGRGSLEFTHAFGLGVLLLGPDQPQALRDLCATAIEPLRARFAFLGERHVLEAMRGAAQTVPIEDLTTSAPPPVDESIDPGALHIAERFAAPPGMNALRLPRDATTRNVAGCTIWIASADGREWRHGVVETPPDDGPVTLAFSPFAGSTPRHLHLFVTDPCQPGTALPPLLAGHLADRRAPIALQALKIELPELPPHALMLVVQDSAA
jgi:hypothetical protein